MKRPLLWPALLFALGVVLGEWFAVPVVPLFLVAGLGLVAAAALERARAYLLLGACLFAGWIHYQLHQSYPAPHDLRQLVGTNVVLATVRGEISDTPSLKLVERRGQLHGRTIFRVQVQAMERNGAWEPATGEVAVSLKGPPPKEFFRTRRLELRGVLRSPPSPLAPDLFDYATYLRHQACWYMLTADGPHDWRLLDEGTIQPPLSERFLPWAQTTLARGLPDDESTRLLWAMALGWKTALTGEVDTVFMESGTMHVFAISGLHIALIAGVIVALLRSIRIPRRWCGVVVIPLVWFYVAATGWQTSAIRSALMSTVVIGSWMLERPGDLFNSLALSLLVVLLWQPGQLFQASFQLSFGVVAGMALLVPVVEPWLLKLFRFDPDPFLPPDLRPRWQSRLEVPLRALAQLLAVSLAAQIASLPLTVHYFHLLNPVSLLANLVVVPMSSLALAANVASLTVGGWWPALGEIFNASGWFWMRLMVVASRAAAELPGGAWYVASPAWFWWIPYYAGWLAIATGWAFRDRAGRWLKLAAVVILGAAIVTGWKASRRVTLTLAGANAVVFDAPGRREDFLIDAGNESTATMLLVPVLHAQGWNSLPSLLVSHGDLQHLGGAEIVLNELPADRLALGVTDARSPAFRHLLKLAGERSIPLHRIQRDDVFQGWTVLHPAATDRFTIADDNAIVLAREWSGVRVLLLSDLGPRGQQALLERTTNLVAHIVVTGVPREGEPLTEALLDRLNPQLVVIASAEYPATERLKPATRERLMRSGHQVLSMEQTGTIRFRIVPLGIQVAAMDGTRILVTPKSRIYPERSP